MEKLQSALEIARKKRGGSSVQSGGARVTRRGPSDAPDPLDSLWEQISPVELDDALLVKNRVVTRKASSDATYFDILRTKLLLQMRRNNWTRTAITSPTSSCGKTTICCNLALGIGRQDDLRCLLFDLDLRRPNVHKVLGTRPEHNIEQCLDAEVPFEKQALRYGDNVAFSLTRSTVTDPVRLMLQNSTAKVLDDIEQVYQPNIMLFDLPPMLMIDDTRAFLKNVDCALIVARADQSTVQQISDCEAEVAEHTNIIGVVLNECRHTGSADAYEFAY